MRCVVADSTEEMDPSSASSEEQNSNRANGAAIGAGDVDVEGHEREATQQACGRQAHGSAPGKEMEKSVKGEDGTEAARRPSGRKRRRDEWPEASNVDVEGDVERMLLQVQVR